MKLNENDVAPPFTATTDSGEKFSLAEEIGKSNIILYFYPKDFTAGCTKESCAFRDNWDRVKSLDARVFGISSDDTESHKSFKEKYSLQFTLLSDPDHEIRKIYGVQSRLIPPRVTFVIDKQGKIRGIFNSQMNISKHIDSALETLSKIQTESQVQ
jgi:peroxiredoxin Q/BCP